MPDARHAGHTAIGQNHILGNFARPDIITNCGARVIAQKYFHSGEINFKVADKEAVLERLREKYGDAKINELDGLTFTYPDYWFNARVSNTESLVRLNLEARTKEIAEEKIVEVSNIIKG